MLSLYDLMEEDVHTEYKEAKNTLPDDFWETYSAFANTDGGTVYLGVLENNQKPVEISGVKNAQKIKSDFFTTQSNTTKASVALVRDDNLEIFQTSNNKTVIKISIPQASYDLKPVFIKNTQSNAYLRRGHSDIKMTPSDLKYFISNSYERLDRKLLDGYDIEADLNLEDIQQYRSVIANRYNNPKYLTMNLKDFLVEFGVLGKDRSIGQYKLTEGGLLFFGKFQSIRDRFPNFQIDYIYKKSTLDVNWLNRVVTGELDGAENIYSFYLKTFSILSTRIMDSFSLDTPDKTRSNDADKLKDVVREALVNMLSHAYYDSEQTLRLNEFENYYEFFNPGSLRITKDEFIHGGVPLQRNPVISVLFRRGGYSENAGSGGKRIFDTVSALKLRLPDLTVEPESTKLTIWNTDFINSFRDIPNEWISVLKLIQQKGAIKVKDVCTELNLSDFKARKLLNEMLANEIISEHGKSVAHRYRFNLNDEYSRFAVQQIFHQQEEFMLKGFD